MTESDVAATLSDYFGWVEETAGQSMTRRPTTVATAIPETTSPASVVVLDFAPSEAKRRRSWWTLGVAAACVAMLVVGLVVAQRQETQSIADRPAPYDPARSGWFRIDLDGIEVQPPPVVDPDMSLDAEVVPGGPLPSTPYVDPDPDIRTWTFAALDDDPVRWLAITSTPADTALGENGPDEATELTDVPDGRAWLVRQNGVTSGPDFSWTRDDGSIVLTYGTNIEPADMAAWTFAALDEPGSVSLPVESGLVEIVNPNGPRVPIYSETFVLDGVEFGALANPGGLSALPFFGFDVIEPEMIGGIAGYRLSYVTKETSTIVLAWPMDAAGYWAILPVLPDLGDRVDEIAAAVVMTPDDPTVVLSVTDDPTGGAATGPSIVLYADRRLFGRDGDQWRVVRLDTEEFTTLEESINALSVTGPVDDAPAVDDDDVRIITAHGDVGTSVTINRSDGVSAEQEPYAVVATAVEVLLDSRESTLLNTRRWVVADTTGSDDLCTVEERPADSARPALPADGIRSC